MGLAQVHKWTPPWSVVDGDPEELGEAHKAFSSTLSTQTGRKALAGGVPWGAGRGQQPDPQAHQVFWTALCTQAHAEGGPRPQFSFCPTPTPESHQAGQGPVGWGWQGATPSPPSGFSLPGILVPGAARPGIPAHLSLHPTASKLVSDSPHIPHTLPCP